LDDEEVKVTSSTTAGQPYNYTVEIHSDKVDEKPEPENIVIARMIGKSIEKAGRNFDGGLFGLGLCIIIAMIIRGCQ